MAAANYWGASAMVGSHHIALGLAERGWHVAYISNPISPFHLLAGADESLRDRWRIHRAGGIEIEDGQIWAYVPGAPATPNNRPLLRSGALLANWPSMTRPSLLRLLRDHGFDRPQLFYIDTLTQAPLARRIDARCKVYRIADMASGFAEHTPAADRAEMELAKSVDLVACAASSTLEYAKTIGARDTLYLPNGVDFDHFAARGSDRPAAYATVEGPIAVYVGAIAEWFDFKLIDQVARLLGDVTIVLIGPGKLARRHFASTPNVRILGPKPYHDLPAYLHHANVGLIPFDTSGHKELVDHVQPIKLLEYFAAGLPVVATSWPELRSLKSPAALAATPSDFAAQIRRAIDDPPDPRTLQMFARERSWSKTVGLLIEKIGIS